MVLLVKTYVRGRSNEQVLSNGIKEAEMTIPVAKLAFKAYKTSFPSQYVGQESTKKYDGQSTLNVSCRYTLHQKHVTKSQFATTNKSRISNFHQNFISNH